MKIERLDLSAFGSFTDTALDFSQAGKTFHIVLGPNAAGKSTALRAIIDLLFGIPERTTDDFLHPSQSLRIGAEIVTADGHRLSCVRRKGRKNTLLDPAGKAMPDSALQALLGVLNREQFVSMFGLDHERLRRGGDDLLRAGGALGESLFEAAGGTRSIRAVLEALHTAADTLFRPRASTAVVNRHIAAYEEARKQARDGALAGEKFRQAEEDLDTLSRTIEAERSALVDLETQLGRLERIQRNLPRAARREQLLEELAELADVPDLPSDAREQRLELTATQRHLTDTLRSDEAEIGRIEEELAALQVPETLLAEGPAMRELTQRLGAEKKASADRPKLQSKLTALLQERDRLLSDARAGLDVERAQVLRLAKPQAARIRELARRQGELATALREGEKGRGKARSRLEEAEARLAQTVAPPDTGPLAEALKAVRSEGNLPKDYAESLARRGALLERARIDAAALPQWRGPLESLVTLTVPLAGTVQQFAGRFNRAEQAVARSRDRAEDLATVLASKDRDLESLRAAGEVPTIGDLDAARARRDDGWKLVRRAFVDAHEDVGAAAAAYDRGRQLPEAYEASVAAADNLADDLRADADRVARNETLRQERAEAAARLAEERERLAQAEETLRVADGEWRDLWRPLNIEPRLPAEMAQWIDAHRRIRETVDAARDEQQRCDTVRDAIDRCRTLIVEALRRVGRAAPDDATDLGVLTSCAEAALADLTETGRLRVKLEEAVVEWREHVRVAEENRTTALQDLERWQQEWGTAVRPLGYDGTAPATEVDEFLRLLNDGLQKHEEVRDTEHRLEGIDRDSGAFARDVAALAARVVPDLGVLPPGAALAAIVERHDRATRDQATRTEKEGHRATLRARVAKARRSLADVEAGIGRLLARASCATVEQLEAVEGAAARKADIRKQLAALEALLVAEGAGLALEQLLAEVADQDGDRIAAAATDLRAEKDKLAAARDGSLRAYGQRQQELDGMLADTGRAAAAAQMAEEELAAVRDRAEDYVRLRLAEIVLREFIERYREQHQDPILQRASALFPLLTRNTFRGVRADFDEKDRAVLIGMDGAGAALRVEAMSDGTRDQLFLALRLAAVEQYLTSGEPLPFIADDLLVHFDDERARAALRVLTDFSQRTQVLFFTHHRHLVELAREVVPPALLGIQTLGMRESQ